MTAGETQNTQLGLAMVRVRVSQENSLKSTRYPQTLVLLFIITATATKPSVGKCNMLKRLSINIGKT